MASTERRRSIGSLFGKEHSLAAPNSRSRTTSKGPASSTVSVASSEDLHKTGLRSRSNSEEARSDTSAARQTRMSKLFKGRKKKGNSTSRSHDLLPHDDLPPVPPLVRPGGETREYSDDSLGLAKSVASSLLTEDSDLDSYVVFFSFHSIVLLYYFSI